MINFQKIRYSNFLATGAAGNEVILNAHPSTLINAKNGSGKSTILDAIIFGLFGKPFRDITKNQLINSVNGKGTLVELWFSIGADTYLIRRGIKPNIFEIFKDSILIDQEAAIRDYQKFLETQILKTNIKAFTQSVILGSANFTPFMQMKPYERREVIEDFLDVKIFGVMNTILKEEIVATKAVYNTTESKFTIAKTQVDGQKKLITKLENINTQAEVAIREKIMVNSETIWTAKTAVDEHQNSIEELQSKQIGMTELMTEIQKLSDVIVEKKHYIKSHSKNLKFFEDNSTCPSCEQDIHETYKKPIIKRLANACLSIRDEIDQLHNEYLALTNEYDTKLAHDVEITNHNTKIRELRQTINSLVKINDGLETEILNLSSSDIMNEKIKLKEMATGVVEIIDEKTKLAEHRAMQDIAYDILKDSGVKTTIIKEYLPIINELINQYLGVMEFYVDFNLDESFSEVVRSRCRDEFTYSSFSEGEKKRLDIAILFAWRQIAKMKNSINCNILFLDEILDGSVDESGLDAVFQIIEEEAKTSNVFVISHNEKFKSKFDNIISITKRGDFSVIQ